MIWLRRLISMLLSLLVDLVSHNVKRINSYSLRHCSSLLLKHFALESRSIERQVLVGCGHTLASAHTGSPMVSPGSLPIKAPGVYQLLDVFFVYLLVFYLSCDKA